MSLSSCGRSLLALVMTASLVVLGVAAAPAAQAHTELESSSPADGASLRRAPAAVVLTFSEEPRSVDWVRAESTTGAAVTLGAPTVKGTTVTAAWPTDAPAGTYRVGWQLTSDDGDPVEGIILFSYAAAASPTASPTPTPTPTSTPTPTPTSTRTPSPTATQTAPSTSTDGRSAWAGMSAWPLVWTGLGVLVVVGTASLLLRRARRGSATSTSSDDDTRGT